MSDVKPLPKKKKAEEKAEQKRRSSVQKRNSRTKKRRTNRSLPISAFLYVPVPLSFDNRNPLEMYVTNSAFREKIDSGRYVYVDGKIVLNSPECVSFQNGKMVLLGVTESNTTDYCLHYTLDVRVGPAPALKPNRTRFEHSMGTKGVLVNSRILADAQKISSAVDVTLDNILLIVGGGGGGGNNDNFAAAITRLMEKNNVTEEKLAEMTGLHPKTIQRMRNPEEHTSLKSVVAVCVAFHLDLYNSIYLIHLAGYELTNRQEDRVYYFILSIAYKETVYDCNRMLERLNMKPLTIM